MQSFAVDPLAEFGKQIDLADHDLWHRFEIDDIRAGYPAQHLDPEPAALLRCHRAHARDVDHRGITADMWARKPGEHSRAFVPAPLQRHQRHRCAVLVGDDVELVTLGNTECFHPEPDEVDTLSRRLYGG